MKLLIGLLIVAVLALIAFSGTFMGQLDEPKYKTVQSDGAIEVREYPSLIVAEVKVPGERQDAIDEGFGLLAEYIFGENMTAEKIPMTAPVTEQARGDVWRIRFMMPETYTLEELPKPKSNQVKLIPLSSKRFAVIRFSGFAGDESIEKHTQKLKNFIDSHHLTAYGEPILALYNPPWTLPFLRRNEVMIEVND